VQQRALLGIERHAPGNARVFVLAQPAALAAALVRDARRRGQQQLGVAGDQPPARRVVASRLCLALQRFLQLGGARHHTRERIPELVREHRTRIPRSPAQAARFHG
jgi:hypothetical protein